jgi:hypothetical protein
MKRSLRFLRSNVRTDLDDEMHFHLQSTIDEYVAAGMSLDAATTKARDRFGDIVELTQTLHSLGQQRERTVERKERLSQLSQDVRFAFRSLRQAPGFPPILARSARSVGPLGSSLSAKIQTSWTVASPCRE